MVTRTLSWTLLLLLVIRCTVEAEEFVSSSADSQTYRAAVLEHEPQPQQATPLETMLANVFIYEENAARAAKQGVQIIVYPEYGLTGEFISTRVEAEDHSQDIPNLKDLQWNPCEEPETFSGNTTILQKLSCIAKNHSLVVVANLITRVQCNSATERKCPGDKHFLFNTNVIFGLNGALLARYHKHHLFMELYLNPSPEPEFVIVDLGFVRLGTFTCFDIMFADPAVQLIETFDVKNIAFPTAWVDSMPHLTSIQTFSGFAYSLGINLLAADLFSPTDGSFGSGIYSSISGALNETYDLATPGRLLIADVPTNPPAAAEKRPLNTSVVYIKENSPLFPVPVYVDVPSSKPVGKIHRIFYEDLSDSSYEFLNGSQGNLSVCQNETCCELEYVMLNRTGDVSYILMAYSNWIGLEKKFYVERCSVVRCEINDIRKCGHVPEKETHANFKTLILEGSFSTRHLYPNIFSTRLSQIPPSYWTFTDDHHSSSYSKTLTLIKTPETPILAATIIGRDYDKIDYELL